MSGDPSPLEGEGQGWGVSQADPKAPPRRIQLTLAYDGTDFRGWAAQAGQRTVQGTLTQSLRHITGEEIEVFGASRTDGGAHARGQVCHFDVSANVPSDKWPRILNRSLPEDLRVVSAQEVGPDFHARFCADWRRYTYRILLEPADPFRLRTAYGYPRTLDLERMRHAAAHLVGEHDFLAFTEELDPSVENTVRTLYQVEVTEKHRQVEIEIIGTAFLRGMMRRISGCLLEIGRGQRSPQEAQDLLTERREQIHWPVVLPAKGLTLEEVRYGDPPVDHRPTMPLREQGTW